MKKLLNFRPFLFLAVGLILGITASKNYICGNTLVGTLILIVTASLVAFGIILGGKAFIKRNIIFSLIFIAVSVVGFGMLNFWVYGFESANLNGTIYSVTGRVEEIDKGANTDCLVLTDVVTEGVVDGNSNYKIMLYVSGTHELDVGDIISFKANLIDNHAIYENNLSSYNIVNKIKYSAEISAKQISKTGHYLTPFESVNIFMRDSLALGLDDDEFSVAYGMLCGNTEYMDYNLITSYRQAGVAHIFAVSGLHIGFMAGFFGFVFRKLKFNRYLSTAITLAVLFLYSGVCGFTPSSLRASVMASVMYISALSGMKYDGLSSIGVACIIVLLISPAQLFCAGFQLSFVVVLGIFLLGRVFARMLKFLPNKLCLGVSTALSAQIASIPISLLHFGEFSLISVFVNVLFIPLVSILFVISLVTCLIGGAFGISKITLFIPNFLLKGINAVVTAMDYQVFIVGGFSFGVFAIFYYAVMLFVSGKVNVKTASNIIISSILSLICVAGTVVYNLDLRTHVNAYVVGSNGLCASLFDVRDRTVMIASKIENYSSTARLKRTLKKTGSDKIDALIVPKSAEGIDVSSVVTKINAFAEISTVYYFDDGSMKVQVLKKAFPKTEFVPCVDGVDIKEDHFNFGFNVDGYGVSFKVNEKRALILSDFGKCNANYSEIDASDCRLVVATDYVENLFSLCDNTELVSYRMSNLVVDGETHGDFWCRFA